MRLRPVASIPMDRTLLLITGAGRSGTSTAAGAMHHLGFHVPGPHLAANASNPRGFYESRWSVEFHNALLRRAGVSTADGRPEAASLVRAACNAADREAIVEWLAEASEGQAVTVLKDPRSTWTLDLWEAAAAQLGLRFAQLVMLRHPAEVLGSRATHYASAGATLGAEGFAVKNLASWINAITLAECSSRGGTRTFVRYDDLLGDWRTTMRAAAADLQIGLDPESLVAPHPVDEFIDPDLSRHRLTFADLDLPAELECIAAAVWRACELLADGHGADTGAEAEVDAARARYAVMYLAAQRLTLDSTGARIQAALDEAGAAARTSAQPPDPSVTEDSGPAAVPASVRGPRRFASRLRPIRRR